MKERPEQPAASPLPLIKPEEVRELTGQVLSGETMLYLATFVTACTSGAVILVIHGLAGAAGTPLDTAYSIVMNLWHAGAAALVLTVAMAGVSKTARFSAMCLRRMLPGNKVDNSRNQAGHIAGIGQSQSNPARAQTCSRQHPSL